MRWVHLFLDVSPSSKRHPYHFASALVAIAVAACGANTGTDSGGSPNGGADAGAIIDPPPNCGGLPAKIRDFKFHSPSDFEDPEGNSDYSYPGLVKVDLGGDGTPVYAPAGPVRPHTSGANNFQLWYHDVAGMNQALSYTIPLTTDARGVSSFSSSAFFPIDGMGFGNEGVDTSGQPHNFSFTTEIHTSFVYRAGDVFTFTGDDDLWLFINHKLAIDLGGLHPPLTGTVDLDARAAELGITIGNTYPMDIFHAERHTAASNFHIETTIDCFIVL
jgi:fibro-slime domain-containing protein